MQSRDPLAYKMMPQTLEDYVGQEHILGVGKILYRMLKAGKISSMILFGPPGTGKTSLAKVIANHSQMKFAKLNAITAGVNDIKRLVEEASNPILTPGGCILLFIDEIHRFNKLQQDALLPAVEDGRIVFIGATTENPFFEVNKALISRVTVFELKPLSLNNIKTIIGRAQTSAKGLLDYAVNIDAEALDFIARRSSGDARIALNALDLAVASTDADAEGSINLTLEVVKECLQTRSAAYDAKGEQHYNVISALIKSMRGSDPDAAIYYLALALNAGEDVEFLARRILIAASEDVGLANPQVLTVCEAVYQGVKMIGMPESRILLAEAVVLVATSPKSNSAYLAINKALAYVKDHPNPNIPNHLKNAVTDGMAELGYGQGYKYAHDYPNHFVNQVYLPTELGSQQFYQAGDLGYEGKTIKTYLQNIEKLKLVHI